MKAEIHHGPNMAIAARAFNHPMQSCDISARSRLFSGHSGHIVVAMLRTRTAAIDEGRANA